jgi:hypothetical protein
MDKKAFDEQYRRAVRAGKLAEASEPRAKAASYDAATNRLIVELRNGVTFIVPCRLIEGLAVAAPEQVAAFELMPRGAALHWKGLDVQVSVPALVAGVFGSEAWMSGLKRGGGRKETKAVTRQGARPRHERVRREATGKL